MVDHGVICGPLVWHMWFKYIVNAEVDRSHIVDKDLPSILIEVFLSQILEQLKAEKNICFHVVPYRTMTSLPVYFVQQ